ncbi:hypothetical protein Tco_0412940 [Tanacetum coccineum]
MIESSWIEAMQEAIHEFEQLEVWELVPRPDKAMIINLKWIFKVKLDEYGGVLKIRLALADAEHTGCQDTRCNTSGSAQFLGEKLGSWTEHIAVRYHFIKEQVNNEVAELYFVKTD